MIAMCVCVFFFYIFSNVPILMNPMSCCWKLWRKCVSGPLSYGYFLVKYWKQCFLHLLFWSLHNAIYAAVTLSTNNGSLFMQSLYAVWISLFYYFHSILSLTFLHEDAFVDKVKSVLLNGNLNSNVFTQRTEPKLLVKQQILHTLTQKTWRHRGEDKNDVIN